MADLIELELEIPATKGVDIDADIVDRGEIIVESKEKTAISHNDLFDRDLANQHPISAISGLSGELDRLSVLASGYIHEQGVASAVWTVQHNLNKYPSVSVVDSAGNEIISEVTYNDENSVTITMNGASKGYAYLN